MRRILMVCIGPLLAACAGPILNENTVKLGPSIGTLEERQVLENLARFADNPWAIPGHVELSNGQIQITNQVGLNLKFPYTRMVNGAGATTAKSIGSEADINPAQTQDQESYNLLPVTDAEDLRRLRAVYHHAVCPGDGRSFAREWAIADQRFFNETVRKPASTPAAAVAPPLPRKRSLAEVVAPVVKAAIAKPGTTAAGVATIQSSIVTPLSEAQTAEVGGVLDKAVDERQATAAIVKIVGAETPLLKPFAAPPASKATKGKNDQMKAAGGDDSTAYEEYRKQLILSPIGLGDRVWLYERLPSGLLGGVCRTANGPEQPYDLRFTYLGTFRNHEFYTDDQKRFSDLVLFVLGSIPNTTGSHILDGGTGSKAGRSQFFTLNGEPGAILPLKATAR